MLRSRTTARVLAGLLAVLVVILAVATAQLVVAGWRMVHADECATGSDCLVVRAGELTFVDNGRGSEHWSFTATTGSVSQLSFGWGNTRALAEGPAESLSWDGDVVAVEVDGKRSVTGSWGLAPASAYAAYLLFAAVGALLLLRRAGHAVRAAEWSWALGAAALGLLFGALVGSLVAGVVLALVFGAATRYLGRKLAD
jgi:outer membrane protein assembly factor BamB